MADKKLGRPLNPHKQTAAAKQRAYRDRQKSIHNNSFTIDEFNFYLQEFVDRKTLILNSSKGNDKLLALGAVNELNSLIQFFNKINKNKSS